MEWNDDMSTAPAGEEWVMGAILIDNEEPELGFVYESVIFDGGMWINSTGAVVTPSAWCRINKYQPKTAYDWESSPAFMAAFEALENMMPEGVYVEGLAVANPMTGEGALIFDYGTIDIHSAVFNADVKKDILSNARSAYADILSDAATAYDGAVTHMTQTFSPKRKH